MTRIQTFLLLFILMLIPMKAQDFALFPSALQFKPLVANFLEPRIGFHFKTGKNDLRLDIGASRDIFHLSSASGKWSAGADFFTYTKLRGEKDFHFPVDAVDYLFGFNGAWEKEINGVEYSARLRFSHISAHMVDGHYVQSTKSWRDGRNPIVYSREFLELMPTIKLGDFRGYAGFTYLIHTTPSTIKKTILQAGAEIFPEELSYKSLYPFAAFDWKVADEDKFSSTYMLGVKFGNVDAGGLSILLTYYSGYDVHGEYYDERDEHFSVGFNIDL